jgi:hypothetical protein
MDANPRIVVDPVHGIEFRAQPRRDRRGWSALWRPSRALKDFPSFTYISREELFTTEEEAIDFMRVNAQSIVSRRM